MVIWVVDFEVWLICSSRRHGSDERLVHPTAYRRQLRKDLGVSNISDIQTHFPQDVTPACYSRSETTERLGELKAHGVFLTASTSPEGCPD